jgi:hypothetical protein
MTEFRGIDRYQQMIGFMARFFNNIQLDLHDIQQHNQDIRTDWTLCLDAPLTLATSDQHLWLERPQTQ